MSQHKPGQSKDSSSYRLLYPLLALAAMALPIVIWQGQLPIVRNSYGPLHEPFEVFTLCASIALGVITWLEIKRLGRPSFVQALPILLFMAVAFHYLIVMNEFEGKSFDYASYENAAKAVITGDNPYTGAYLYPPFTAQAMALAFRVLESWAAIMPVNSGPEMGWFLTFYLYQCLQFVLILAAFVLCLKFIRRAGMAEPAASIIVAAVFLINNPLVRTLKHHQVNLWILDLMLLAVLFVSTRPWLTGLAVAVSSHIKIYPMLLMLPFIVMKRFKAVLWSIVGIALIWLLQTGCGQSFELYRQFFGFAKQFPASIAFRDNGIYSIVYNTLGLTGMDVASNSIPANAITWVLTVAAASWFVIRLMRREKSWSSFSKAHSSAEEVKHAGIRRAYGHFADAIALMLLLSPIVWEHHYVLSLPVILWAIVTQGWKKPWAIGIGAFLILAVPTFDVFPLSYNRLAGLLILTYLTPPEITLAECHSEHSEESLDPSLRSR